MGKGREKRKKNQIIKKGAKKKVARKKKIDPRKGASSPTKFASVVSGEVKSINLIPGKRYRIIHSRKNGNCIVECVKPDAKGGEFIVREGDLSGIGDYYGPGDPIFVINNLARFFEIPDMSQPSEIIYGIKAEGDVVYVKATSEAAAIEKLYGKMGEIPRELLMIAPVDVLPEGEELL